MQWAVTLSSPLPPAFLHTTVSRRCSLDSHGACTAGTRVCNAPVRYRDQQFGPGANAASPGASRPPLQTVTGIVQQNTHRALASERMADLRAQGGLRDKYLAQTAACPKASLPSSTSWAAAARQPLPARDQAHGMPAQARGPLRPDPPRSPVATCRSKVAATQRSPAAAPSRAADQRTLAACGRRSPSSGRAGGCRSPHPAAVLMVPASPRARTPGTPDSAAGAISIPSSPAAEAVSVRSSPSAEHAAGGRKRTVCHLRLDMSLNERRLSCGSRYPRGSLDLPSDGSGANAVRLSLAAGLSGYLLSSRCLSELQACRTAVTCVPCD